MKNKIRDNYDSFTFKNECDLVYEQQIPNTGIVLIKGQLTLLKKKKIEKEITAGGMIGVYNLINNNPSSVTCKVQGDSELIMLQKSQILEALNDEKSELYAIIKEELTG